MTPSQPPGEGEPICPDCDLPRAAHDEDGDCPPLTPPPPSEPGERRIGGLTRELWERWFRQAKYQQESLSVKPAGIVMWDDTSIQALVAAAFDGERRVWNAAIEAAAAMADMPDEGCPCLRHIYDTTGNRDHYDMDCRVSEAHAIAASIRSLASSSTEKSGKAVVE